MKNKLLFSVMLVCVALFVYHGATLAGITGKIAGLITDAATGEPMPAVNVVIEGTTLGGATDNEGHFFIINIPPGTYSLQASMVGYAVESKTGIIVNVDHTTPVDFDLRVTAIAGEEVTVTAEREIVPMDISASQIVADAEQIAEVPLITDIAQYIHLQAGILGDEIRGGGLDQTEFMMDGLMVVDNRTNKPMMMVNLSAMKELNIIKGGFNPEYGNVRSGLINVITKEGSPSVYHGSFDFRIRPPGLKHSGESIFNPMNWNLRPYLDEDVCWVGTKNGTWDIYTQDQYNYFQGWNAISEGLLGDDDPTNDMTAEQARDRYMWLHTVEGSAALGQKERKYYNKPDWNLDVSFGGPVPYGQSLGNLSFFVSHRTNWEMMGLPVYREWYKENNTSLKITSRLSASMKLTFEGMYGTVYSVSRSLQTGGTGDGGPVSSGHNAISRSTSYYQTIYYPSSLGPFDVWRAMQGISFDHVLSPRTFYNIRISRIHIKNHCAHNVVMRNSMTDPVTGDLIEENIKRYFGSVPVDESPYGAMQAGGPKLMYDNFYYGAHSAGAIDLSKTGGFNVKFDLTSQVDRYNQVKVGFMFNYDDIYTETEHLRWESTWENRGTKWHQFPFRYGGYVQDKLEFEGMIANFGVRLDYNEPNCDWFDYETETYSKYFTQPYKDVFLTDAPQKRAKGHLLIQPRLGVSHPISEEAKLYFNYGHFYSMPSSNSMYQIQWGRKSDGVRYIGNPSAKIPRTVSYELGVEYNIANLFLIHLSGYYKDSGDQTGSTYYESYDGLVNYGTVENRNYSDIRGFELRLDKRFGRWITGWFNYNYMVETSGYVGRDRNYEDPRMQRVYGDENPYQERPLARPVMRANINIRTPGDWGPGPTIGGVKILGDIHLATLYSWRAGSYFTWDPLETFELVDNLQWKASVNVDQRISKRMRFGKYSVQIFADINNLFNIKRINSRGFQDDTDRYRYYESLHLPLYNGEEYKEAGYTGGNDKPGDLNTDKCIWCGNKKDYINMPNRDYLTYLNQRYVYFGIKIDF